MSARGGNTISIKIENHHQAVPQAATSGEEGQPAPRLASSCERDMFVGGVSFLFGILFAMVILMLVLNNQHSADDDAGGWGGEVVFNDSSSSTGFQT